VPSGSTHRPTPNGLHRKPPRPSTAFLGPVKHCLRSLGTRDLPGYAEYTEQVRFRLFPLSGDKRRETLGFAPHMFLIRRLAISNISPGSWSGEKPARMPCS
jgi:hypothetical protein